MSNLSKDQIHLVPHGLVVTRAWLIRKGGIERHTLDNWIKSGRLVSVNYGVYKKPDTKLTWMGLVCSLQYMGYDLCPGGLTSLELQGLSHYLPLSPQKIIHLYGLDKLPNCISTIASDVTFMYHCQKRLFDKRFLVNSPCDDKYNLSTNNNQLGGKSLTTSISWGMDSWLIAISSPERALFEVLAGVPEKISFEHADQLIEGMITLSPRRLNVLLELCKNVKVRRLFLWFAERHNHQWFSKVDTKHFNMESHTLGSGKRALFHGGKLDHKYLITVPPEMYDHGGIYGSQ